MGHFHIAAPTALLATALLLAGCNSEAASTPDAIVQGIVHDFARSQEPSIIWDSLPAKYQTDLTDLLHSASAKVDKDLYLKGLAVARKLAKVLEQQKKFFLGNSMIKPLAMRIGEKRIDKEWQSTVNLLETLVSSELADVDSLRDLDVGKFLQGTGASFMKAVFGVVKPDDMDLSDYLRRVKFKLQSRTENTATLKVFPPNAELVRVEFTKVDGKWLPSDLVKDWDLKVSAARKLIEDMPDPENSAGNLRTRFMLKGLDNFLTNIAKAKNQRDFDKLVHGLFKLLELNPATMPGMMPNMMPPPRKAQEK